MKTEVRKEMLVRTVGSVFITMLGLEVSPSEIPRRPAGDLLTSYVQLTGDWNGAVLLECTRQQACRFAGMILSTDPPDTVDDNVRDVLGELANVIGGNMKCVMATAARLSMPTVIEGGDDDVRVFGSKARERLTFDSSEGNFWVTILIAK
ncbi:MAG: chemotaxis protein CheX [Acidobacteriaceae bacterium]|jgi:chemotaxis protein CheX